MARTQTDTAEAFVARRQARRITRLQNALREALELLDTFRPFAKPEPRLDGLDVARRADELRKVLG